MRVCPFNNPKKESRVVWTNVSLQERVQRSYDSWSPAFPHGSVQSLGLKMWIMKVGWITLHETITYPTWGSSENHLRKKCRLFLGDMFVLWRVVHSSNFSQYTVHNVPDPNMLKTWGSLAMSWRWNREIQLLGANSQTTKLWTDHFSLDAAEDLNGTYMSTFMYIYIYIYCTPMLDHISVSRLNDPNQEVQRLASNWKSNNNSWASNLKPSAGITKCTIHQDFAMESSLLFSLPLMAKKLCHMRCVSAQVDAVSGRKCIRNHVFQPNETGWILKLNRNKLSRIGWNQGTFGLSTFTKKSDLNVAGKQNKHIDSSWGDNISGHVTRSTWGPETASSKTPFLEADPRPIRKTHPSKTASISSDVPRFLEFKLTFVRSPAYSLAA